MAKLATALVDARIDLNPHQIDAALFAFQSPLSKGAILADEVGLGKTIEAGILLSQSWAERKRNLLIICPASLRKQWSQELWDKFTLPSFILESKTFNSCLKEGRFVVPEEPTIIICSYQFAQGKAGWLRDVDWHLVIMDEAHRLRNVYKNGNRIATTLKAGLTPYKKVLLTATPLQNTLLELYGLVSMIDETVFGDLKTFRQLYLRQAADEDFSDLRNRLQHVCKRHLRSQVQEYIRYTNRIPLTIQFEPGQDETALYQQVSKYLQSEVLYALPASQRHLMTMMLRKLLASSSFAIAATLQSLIDRLEQILRNEVWADVTQTGDDQIELSEETRESAFKVENAALTEEEKAGIAHELTQLNNYLQLARQIQSNSKGEKLLAALEQGFARMQPGAARKAIVFTESTRTQKYLLELLEANGYAGKIVLFNGTNSDPRSNDVYRQWMQQEAGTGRITGSPTADKRAALVDYFRNEATIMIATEAAAEGINLQFCSLVINFDLPWNPQRIEQRIGRCHRYGQQYDVVVVNFLNIRNAADVRVFQLLEQKFKLFEGVFGASDEVLGSIESGVDFESRIADIYQRCRTEQEINEAFDALRAELDSQINERMRNTREKLLANFDVDVIDKLKLRLHESRDYLSRYENYLWQVTRFVLQDDAEFDDQHLSFTLSQQPVPGLELPLSPLTIGRDPDNFQHYRIGHPLAQFVIRKSIELETRPAHLEFHLAIHQGRIAALEQLAGKKGWLMLQLISVKSFEEADHLLATAVTDDGIILDEDQTNKLWLLQATVHDIKEEEPEYLANRASDDVKQLLLKWQNRDNRLFAEETDKLHRWAEDKMKAAETAITETKRRLQELKREASKSNEPGRMIALQEQIQGLEKRQKRQRAEVFTIEDEIAERRDQLIIKLKERLKQETSVTPIFTIQWSLM